MRTSDDPPKKHGVELNSLNKDFQRLLWKNRVKFPKADAQLKILGLSVRGVCACAALVVVMPFILISADLTSVISL